MDFKVNKIGQNPNTWKNSIDGNFSIEIGLLDLDMSKNDLETFIGRTFLSRIENAIQEFKVENKKRKIELESNSITPEKAKELFKSTATSMGLIVLPDMHMPVVKILDQDIEASTCKVSVNETEFVEQLQDMFKNVSEVAFYQFEPSGWIYDLSFIPMAVLRFYKG